MSLGLAGIPAGLLTLGAIFVVDTPNSLIERGHLDEGRAVLKRIRGTDNVEPEYLELVEASRVAKEVKHPFRNLLKRRNRPQLIIAVALQVSSHSHFKLCIVHAYLISSRTSIQFLKCQVKNFLIEVSHMVALTNSIEYSIMWFIGYCNHAIDFNRGTQVTVSKENHT